MTQVQDTPEFREWFIGVLRSNSVKDVTVTFTKQDGTDRTMRCTLVESHIPTDKLPKGTGIAHTEDVQRVFDVDLQAWRSFKWASVKNVKFDIGE